MTRVLVAAASPAVRAGLRALLAAGPALTVLEADVSPAGLPEALEAAEADVVLLALEPADELPLPLSLPPDAVARAPAVVVMGGDAGGDGGGWTARALRAGALGAIPRTATAEQIVAAVSAAAAGLAVVPAPGTPGAIPRRPPPPRSAAAPQPLTAREAEVLGMLAEGLGNKAIAARLGISGHTVKTHVGAIFTKLGVATRAEAVASAARRGLIML